MTYKITDVGFTLSGQLDYLPKWAQAMYNSAQCGQADDYDPWHDYGIFDIGEEDIKEHPDIMATGTLYITLDKPPAAIYIMMIKK